MTSANVLIRYYQKVIVDEGIRKKLDEKNPKLLCSQKEIKLKLAFSYRNDTVTLSLFEQSADFVRFVNSFADSTQRLPEHWQSVGGNPVSEISCVDKKANKNTL